MLSILIIDDTPEKIAAIKEVVSRTINHPERLDTATCVNQALQFMQERQYDLALLDFYIPMDWDSQSVPHPENAINLLNEVAENEEVNAPVSILAITKARQVEKEHQQLLHKSNCILLSYSEESDVWRVQLSQELLSIRQIKQKILARTEYRYDVAIITALQYPENDQLRRVFGGAWTEIRIPGDDSTAYYESTINNAEGKSIRIVTAFQHRMGSIASSMLTTKVIYNFRPRFLFMTGIAAAVKTNQDGVNYGDVLVASEVWDAASGKIKETPEDPHLFMPDIRQLPLDSDIQGIVERLKEDKDTLFKIASGYPSKGHAPKSLLDLHLGPMASVPAVIASGFIIDEIKKQGRNLLGIEMESYGMFYAAANAIKNRPVYVASFKSVSDYATKEKSDDFQEYAAYTSAAVLKHILQNLLKF